MEATPEQNAEGLAIVRVLSAVLDRLVQANGPIAQVDPGQITKFHAMKAPGIGIQHYLERIHKYSSCSNECFIFALIYIDRLIQRSNFLLTELNVHRVVITAVLLAAKFFDDAYYNNAYYAKVGGVLVSEMNGLEVDFLFRINFSLHVTPDVFEKYRAELMMHSNNAAVVTPPPSVGHHSPTLVPSPPQQAIVGRSPPGLHQQHHVDVESWNMAAEVLMNATQLLQHGSHEQLVHDPVSHPQGRMTTSGDDVCMGDAVFPAMQRANSLPHVIKAHPTPTFCVARHAQPNCYPQPMGPPPVTNRMPFPDEPFGLMERHIYPIQNTLVHHHHGSYHFPNPTSEATAYNARQQQLVGRMLAGVSGAGI